MEDKSKRSGSSSKDIPQFKVKVYENILDLLRSNELAILNKKRADEIKQMQVLDPHWYELKNKKFNKELKRNRIRNKANEHMEKRIKKLMDDRLY